MKNIFSKIALIGALSFSLIGCDLLDRDPLDQVGPDSFYTNAEQLGSFTFNYYPSIFPTAGGWDAGVAARDNGTDNQAGVNPNRGWFTKDVWKVPAEGGIGFNAIRNVNWFIENITQKLEAKTISGSKADIDHYFGEAYFIRAALYYQKLQAYGDFPIITKVLPDDRAALIEASKRMPRNEVARFILSDLDKAISLLKERTPMNQRISRNVALLFKSRVALFEATFEKYHQGSGRVPGDPTWPGKDKEWNKGKTFNIAAEIDFFLSEAMSASKAVVDALPNLTENSSVMNPVKGQHHGWNKFYEMYADEDLSKYPEILLWRQYSKDKNSVHLTSHKLATGSSSGWTRSLVESFLMKNGLPIYAQNSGYTETDETIDLVKKDRDERLQLFLFGESDVLYTNEDPIVLFNVATILANNETRDVTGYRQRKFYNYDKRMHLNSEMHDVSGTIIFRTAEAYLNYIEASYEKNKVIDGTARAYWDALRRRAGITAPIEVTTGATDMAYEANTSRDSYDWGAFSAGAAVDQTLYSIRRERRSEYAGEGEREHDLKRWRAMDQVKNYHIEGINFWDKTYTNKKFYGATGNFLIVADGSSASNMSAKELSKYIRPYQIIKANNDVFDGYTFYQAHYLSPFSLEELRMASPTGDPAASNLYQNPGWKAEAETPAEY
ncbi:MAG: RagB/SusD family nutrient uptake outer membrane protein [Porphyromonas sp.]|nr:RagB/SusD family nutrient uptake outer membrane protein [Porphyromonas sp.]